MRYSCRSIYLVRHILLFLLIAALLIPSLCLAAVPVDIQDPAYMAFFPVAKPEGEVLVTLVPHPDAVLRVVPVSFGIPFPPGYVNDPKMIALFDNTGKELPIHVTVLARWQPPVPGSPSLRAVLVQYFDVMATRKPRTYTLRWGKLRRENQLEGWPADQGWFQVADGSYPAFRVKDPVAWATFPAKWLCQSLVKGRLAPAGVYRDYDWLEYGRWAYFRQAINKPILADYQQKHQKKDPDFYKIPYKTKYEPWLFDRTTTIFLQYLTTGKLQPLAYALRDVQYYASNVQENGNFALLEPGRPPSVIYGNQEALTIGWFFSGLPKLKIATTRLLKLLDAWNPEYSPKRTFWTERHLAFHLMIATAAYEMTGDRSLLEHARRTFEIGYSMQINPPPGAPSDGCLVHTGEQHSSPVKGWICSPWMSVLFVDAAMRYYLVSADSRVPKSIIMLADFLLKHGTYSLQPKNAKRTYTYPYYLVSSKVNSGQSWALDWQHCLDVSKIAGLAYYFSFKHGHPSNKYKKLYDQLMLSAQEMIPKKLTDRVVGYRLAPARKFSWWFRTTGEIPWIMHQP